MKNRRLMAGTVLGAMIAAGALVAPAFGAGEPARRVRPVSAPRTAVDFTPAAADPRLAALLARGGFDPSAFRFTPAVEAGRAPRAVTVALRGRTTRGDSARAATPAANVGIAPIAYSLGASVGWKRVTIAGDVNRVDLAQQPGGREQADVGVTYSGNRISGRVKGVVERQLTNAVEVGPDASYLLDASTSYRLTRNLDVTAGVRYRTDRERLARSVDERRESQAVYVGTAFRF